MSPPEPTKPTNPCIPSPCGPNALCQVHGETPACSCVQNYIGSPPNCRPECTINPECSSNLACINQRCVDPCVGSCGLNAVCSVINHVAICTCIQGYNGDPFASCQLTPSKFCHELNFHFDQNGGSFFFYLKLIDFCWIGGTSFNSW